MFVLLAPVLLSARVRTQKRSPADKGKEHIAAAEDFIRGLIIEKVMIVPAPPGRDIVAIDASIIANVPDRANKVQAPEPLKPANRFGSPQGSIDHL